MSQKKATKNKNKNQSGDCTEWLIADRQQVNGAFYSNYGRIIYKSALSNVSYNATWYNRDGTNTDPYVCMQNYATDCLYAGASTSVQTAQTGLSGFNVFIREANPCLYLFDFFFCFFFCVRVVFACVVNCEFA